MICLLGLSLGLQMEMQNESRLTAAFNRLQLLAFLSALALLICDTAAGLAGRLARSLALTAATVLGAVAQVASFNGLNMFHGRNLHLKFVFSC